MACKHPVEARKKMVRFHHSAPNNSPDVIGDYRASYMRLKSQFNSDRDHQLVSYSCMWCTYKMETKTKRNARYQSEWYQKNKDLSQARTKANTKIRIPKMRAALVELKSKPCMDCGNTFPSCVMDFDHRNPEDKKYNVSQMVCRYSWTKILEEIAKCDLVCANCHRIRTWT